MRGPALGAVKTPSQVPGFSLHTSRVNEVIRHFPLHAKNFEMQKSYSPGGIFQSPLDNVSVLTLKRLLRINDKP